MNSALMFTLFLVRVNVMGRRTFQTSSKSEGTPLCYAMLVAKLNAERSRILERQKMLQTGQVLFRRLSVEFALVLPFKDSSEAAEPRCSTPIAIKLPDMPRRSEAPPR
jgi:hypothetical protein